MPDAPEVPHNLSCQSVPLHKYDPNTGVDVSSYFYVTATITTNCTVHGNTVALWHSFNGFHGKQLKVGYLKVSNTVYFWKLILIPILQGDYTWLISILQTLFIVTF